MMLAPFGDDNLYYMTDNYWMQIELNRSSPVTRVVTADLNEASNLV